MFSSNTSQDIPASQQEYTTPGTYSWVCPTNVTNVSIVCIGGGGGGGGYGAPDANNNGGGGQGGAGGGLGYKNGYPVTPGTSYTVVVGSGGTAGSPYSQGNNGGDSYFVSTSVVIP